MIDDLKIRPGNQSDKEIVTTLVNTTYTKMNTKIYKNTRVRLTDKEFDLYCVKKEIFVAVNSGNIVGCVRLARLRENEKELSLVVVSPQSRGQGIGRKLVDFALDLARTDGCQTVLLDILAPANEPDPHREALKRWYSSLGFEFVKNRNFIEFHPAAKEHLITDVTYSLFAKKL